MLELVYFYFLHVISLTISLFSSVIAHTFLDCLGDQDQVQLRPKAPTKPARTFASVHLDDHYRVEPEKQVDVQKSQGNPGITQTSQPSPYANHFKDDGNDERVLKKSKKKKKKHKNSEHVYAKIDKKHRKNKNQVENIYEEIKDKSSQPPPSSPSPPSPPPMTNISIIGQPEKIEPAVIFRQVSIIGDPADEATEKGPEEETPEPKTEKKHKRKRSKKKIKNEAPEKTDVNDDDDSKQMEEEVVGEKPEMIRLGNAGDKNDVSTTLSNPLAKLKKETVSKAKEEEPPKLNEISKADHLPIFRMAPASTANVPGTGSKSVKPFQVQLDEDDDNDLDLSMFRKTLPPPKVPKVKPQIKEVPKGLTKEEEKALEEAQKAKEKEAVKLAKLQEENAKRQAEKRIQRKAEEEARLAVTRQLKIDKDLKAQAKKEADKTPRPTTEDLRAQLKAMTAASGVKHKKVVDDLQIDEDDELLPARTRKSSSSSSSTDDKEESGLVKDHDKGMCMIVTNTIFVVGFF